jgi:hypothetical protein
LTGSSRHYPLPVHFNGIECKRQDWLADALYRAEWNGNSIGVFTGHTRHPNTSLNFHGVTVPCNLPTVSEVFGGSTFYARVDIHDSPALQLVLPARKEAVENDALRDLRVAAERAIFLAIGQRPNHKLPFATWSRARELGVVLPEADPQLYSWQPATADSTSDFGLSQPMPAADAILVESSGPDTEQCVARALRTSPLRAQMVDELDAYRGYIWYDGLARIDNFRFDIEHDGGSLTIANAIAVPVISDHLRATKITLRADLHDKGQIYPIAEDTDVAFVSDDAIWPASTRRASFIRARSPLKI